MMMNKTIKLQNSKEIGETIIAESRQIICRLFCILYNEKSKKNKK